MDLRQAAATWLSGQLASYASSPISYIRGTVTLTGIPATITSSLLKLSDPATGVKMVRTDADFIFAAELLVIDGKIVEPRWKDFVTLRFPDGVTRKYECLGYGGSEPHFRYADPERTMLRVHTKLIGVV